MSRVPRRDPRIARLAEAAGTSNKHILKKADQLLSFLEAKA